MLMEPEVFDLEDRPHCALSTVPCVICAKSTYCKVWKIARSTWKRCASKPILPYVPPAEQVKMWINKVAAELQLPETVRLTALDLRSEHHQKLIGRRPRIVAAALLYITCIENGYPRLTQRAIRRQVCCSELALRNTLKTLHHVDFSED